MSNGFIKNDKILNEEVASIDHLDFSLPTSTLSEKISSRTESFMIGIVGAFGIGKSTLILQTRNMRAELKAEEEWIHFDAWQFPDRRELWEGLVLETAKHLSKLEVAKRQIDGNSGKEKQLAVDTTESALGLATSLLGLPGILKPIFGLVKNLQYFAEGSPARRVFEIQEIFASLISNMQKDRVVFVLEDVDRSGEAGLFFLETFRQFISNTTLDKKVIVIVAVSDASYYKNLESYLKCLDFVEFFNKRKSVNFQSFVSEVFAGAEQAVLVDFLSYIYDHYSYINMRVIKLILRQANLNYIEFERLGYEPNPLICIALTAAKYIFTDLEKTKSFFERFWDNRSIESGNEINRLILVAGGFYVHQNQYIQIRDSGQLAHTQSISLVTRISPLNVVNCPSVPYLGRESGIYLPDFYFQNL